MFNNPYYNAFGGFNGAREPNQQQPIQNIFTNQMPSNNTFMARFLKEGENPQETFVNGKTALISLSDKKLYIKELDGSINAYEIVLPLDEKDKQIEELKNELKELKGMITNEQFRNDSTNVSTSDEISQPNGNDKKSSRK